MDVCREDHHQPDGGSLCDGGERPRVRLDVRPPTSSTCRQPVGPFDGTAERLIYETRDQVDGEPIINNWELDIGDSKILS